MSNDSGWWSRHLGTPQHQQPSYPPTGYQQQPNQYAQPQYPQQHPQYPNQQQAPQYQQQQQVKVTPENLFEAAKTWQGGEATRNETQPCPKCGSGHYFSRAGGNTRGPSPAPVCYTCGYNGMFVQGDPATWQGA